MDFKNLFQHHQRVLELELMLARERFGHYGLRGGAVEMAMRQFLKQHLPRSLDIGTGEIIASESDTQRFTSGQVDIVISNSLQPFLGSQDTPTTFLIEGIHMAGEVKTVLERSKVKGELEKAGLYRSLRARNMSRLVSVPQLDTWLEYYVHYRPYFIFSLETKGDWRSILLEVMAYIKINNKIPLDGIFLMDQGIAIFLSPHSSFPLAGRAGIPFEHSFKGCAKGTGGIHIYSTDVILALFVSWISSFRSSFFEDIHPLAVYVEKMLNESFRNMVLFDGGDPSAELDLMNTVGLFEYTLRGLQSKFDKTRK